MPLRTLLGYDPRAVKTRADYGRQFLAFGPSKNSNLFAMKKTKYPGAMNRVKKLPPINEEGDGTPRGTPAATPRVNLRNKPDMSIRRLPKKALTQRDLDDESMPLKARPIIPVYPMRRETFNAPPLSPEIDDPKKPIIYEYTSKKRAPAPIVNKEPMDQNHTIIDGLVADYLHYARYGHVIPVYEGTSSTSCPCCTGRNRQNVRSLLGFSKPPPEPPNKYDKMSHVTANADYESKHDDFPNSMYAKTKRREVAETRISPREQHMRSLAHSSLKGSWMNYQPHPNASHYLNAEFNRPSVVQDSLYDSNPVEVQRTMANRIVEANSNYTQAMNRLESFSLGGSTSTRGYD